MLWLLLLLLWPLPLLCREEMEGQQDLVRALRARLYPENSLPLFLNADAYGEFGLLAKDTLEDGQHWCLEESRHITDADGRMAMHVDTVEAGQEVLLKVKENIPGQKWVLCPP